MEAAKFSPLWRNEVTVRSLELTFSFEPAAYLHRIAPRPLMVIAAEGNTLMPIEAARAAFAQSAAARDWFVTHLLEMRRP